MLKKYRTLIKLAEEHRQVPLVTNEKRHLGIILSIVGWLLFAFYTILFELEIKKQQVEVAKSLTAIFIGFAIFHFFMFLVFLSFSLPRGIKFFKPKEPKLLYARSFFAIIGFATYSLSRVWTSVVDNSMLYSTDAFWIVIFLLLLGIKLKRVAIFGVIVGLIGILFIYWFDTKTLHDIIGGIFGSVSGFTLALITIITSYLVKQDPPLRIGLYQSFFGFMFFSFCSVIFGVFQGWQMPNFFDFVTMSFSGFFFAFTLFCIWEAFYYTESYIIGVLSYFLPVFIIVLGWILNQEPFTFNTFVGTFLLTLGSFIVVIASYLTNKGNRKKTFGDSSSVATK